MDTQMKNERSTLEIMVSFIYNYTQKTLIAMNINITLMNINLHGSK